MAGTLQYTKCSCENAPCLAEKSLVHPASSAQGWHHPRVEPYGPLPFELSCMVFHYAQEIFEGMKASTRHLRL